MSTCFLVGIEPLRVIGCSLHRVVSMDITTTNFPLITTNVYVDSCDLVLRVVMTSRPVTFTHTTCYPQASRLFHLFSLFQVIGGKKDFTLSSCLSTYSQLSMCPTGHFLYGTNCAMPVSNSNLTVLLFGSPLGNLSAFVHSKRTLM
jgi:hypothetical protein